jgi:hypothetical protein
MRRSVAPAPREGQATDPVPSPRPVDTEDKPRPSDDERPRFEGWAE